MNQESRWYSMFKRLNQNFMKIRITLILQSAVFKLVSYLSVLSLGGLWRHCLSVAMPKSSSPKFLSRPSRIWGGHVTSGGNMTSDDDEDDKIKDNVTTMTTTMILAMMTTMRTTKW